MEAGPSRRKPFGPMGLRPNSLSLVVADVNTSTPPRFAISARKPHRRLLCYFRNRATSKVHSVPGSIQWRINHDTSCANDWPTVSASRSH